MESWSQGTWVDPSDGITKASVTVSMNPNAKWSDGQPVTIDDFIYTLAILPGELKAKGCSDAWWQPTLDQVSSYYKLDPYSATILMKSNTYLALTWIVGNVVLPKHFWQPFVAANPALTIMGDLGTGLIGSGPFLFTALAAGTSATMVRNPTYYHNDPVSITVSYDNPTADKLGPNKYLPHNNGTGITLTIVDKNEDQFSSVSYTKTVTIKKVNPPGATQTLVNNAPVGPVAPGASVVETFTLNLTLGQYEVTVNKTITAGTWTGKVETRTESVYVTIVADLNNDIVVDIFDIAPIAIAFGTTRDPPVIGYNPVADLNRDGTIDIFDIVQVAIVFGWPA
jgi:hypothetical protein